MIGKFKKSEEGQSSIIVYYKLKIKIDYKLYYKIKVIVTMKLNMTVVWEKQYIYISKIFYSKRRK